MLNYVRQFFRIGVFFHTLHLWNEVGGPNLFFFFISASSNSLSDYLKILKIYRLKNFCPNVLERTTTATVTGTWLNKRCNLQDNGCPRATWFLVHFFAFLDLCKATTWNEPISTVSLANCYWQWSNKESTKLITFPNFFVRIIWWPASRLSLLISQLREFVGWYFDLKGVDVLKRTNDASLRLRKKLNRTTTW